MAGASTERRRLLMHARRQRRRPFGGLVLVLMFWSFPAPAVGGDHAAPTGAVQTSSTFHDIAAGGRAGIDYRRVPSATNAHYEVLKHQGFYTFADFLTTPDKPRGSPGVALLDFDNDGALDIFVTNGPGAGNKLYRNLLLETGRLRFVDVATRVGVAAPDMDATGVCFGDVNNDGRPDLYVLG